jgi:hypothetical protein
VPVTLLVPRGAEEKAVRRAAPEATVVAVAAGARAAVLPPLPAWEPVVVLGLCGALTDARVGDVVVYDRLCDESGSTLLDGDAIAAVARVLPDARAVAACTADRVIATAAERVALATRLHADVVDMEAAHVARALVQAGLRFAMVRVVSDDPRRDLPPIADAIAPDGSIRPLILAAAFARAPAAAARFVRDVQASLRVLGRAGAALVGLNVRPFHEPPAPRA